MSTSKKYFWLKLRRDFFKRHDTKIIEAMENGKDYLLFYLKLLVESIDHDGNLRFSDTIPYNDKMLSVITDTNIDVVRSAVKVFSELGMMDQMDDGTLFMNHVNTMIGYETSDALRMRERRGNAPQILIEQNKGEQCSNLFKNRSPELELDSELEIESDNINSAASASPSVSRRFTKPTLEEVSVYCKERRNSVDAQAFLDFYESKGWKVGNTPMKSWQAAVRTWERRETVSAKYAPRGQSVEVPSSDETREYLEDLKSSEVEDGFEFSAADALERIRAMSGGS